MNRLSGKRLLARGLSILIILGLLLTLGVLPAMAEMAEPPASSLPDESVQDAPTSSQPSSQSTSEASAPIESSSSFPSFSDSISSGTDVLPPESTLAESALSEQPMSAAPSVASTPQEILSDPLPVSSAPAEEDEEPQETAPEPVALAQMIRLAAQDVHGYLPGGGSILNNMTLTYQDASGAAVTDPTIDSIINFNFDVMISPDVAAQVMADDYYDFTLPDNVSIPNGINGVQLYDGNGVLYGTFSVTSSNDSVSPRVPAVVHMVFTDAVQSSGGLTGKMFFQGNFNKSNISTPGDNVIDIPGESDLTAHLNIKPRPGSSIDKQGVFTGGSGTTNPTGVSWTIDFNKEWGTLTNAVFTDAFPPGLDLDPLPAPSVYRVSVDLYGNVLSSPAPVPIQPGPDTYTVDTDGTIRFHMPVTDCYRVTYSTPIDSTAIPTLGGNMSFTNNASVASDELDTPLTASSSLTARFDKTLSKINSGVTLENHDEGLTDQLDPTFHWTVDYNGVAGIEGVYLTDIYDDSVSTTPAIQFDPASLHIYTASYQNGKLVRGDELPYGAAPAGVYTVESYVNESDESYFTITFADTIDDQYNNQLLQLVYDTYASQQVLEGFSKPNTITLGGGQINSTSHQTVGQQVGNKTLTRVDKNTQTLTWQVIVNQNRYELTGLAFVDTMSAGLSYVADSLVIEDISNPGAPIPLVGRGVDSLDPADADYSLGVASQLPPGSEGDIITATFLPGGGYSPTDSIIRITYQTSYDVRYLPASGAFFNTANITFNGGSVTSTGTYSPSDEELNNGGKQAVYNAVTQTITWSVFVDYANTGFRNAYLLDPIQNNTTNDPSTWQSFVPDSVRVYHYDIGPDNVLRKGSELTEGEYQAIGITEPVESTIGTPDYVLKVTFPDDEDPPVRYWVEYQTSVSGQSIQARYDNTATLYNDLYPATQLTAHVDIAYGGQLLEKEGQQGADGYAHWQVLINPSQSAFPGAINVVDVPSANQTVLTESLAIYPGIVDAAGNITEDTANPLAAGADYTFTYAPVAGIMTLTVNIPIPAGQTTNTNVYVMTYKASLQYTTGEAVVNTVNINGDAPLDNGPSSEDSITVNNLTGGGILVGRKVGFNLYKQGIGGAAEPLAGVTFRLYDQNGNQVGGDYVTDAQGIITFTNLVIGTYTLREVSLGSNTTANYVIDDDSWNGQLLNVTENMGPIYITNRKSRVVLTKLGDGEALTSGLEATYNLFRDDGAGGYLPVAGYQNISTTQGQLAIDGLAAGSYQLREVTAPTGYVLNSTPASFEFIADADRGMTPATIEVEHNNYKGRVSFMKTDNQSDLTGDADNPVAGAQFTIRNDTGAGTPYYEDVAYSGTDGMVYFYNIPPGSYYIAETGDPPGWPGNTGSYVIPAVIPNAAAGNSDPANPIYVEAATAVNFLTEGTVILYKSDSNSPSNGLPGAEFDVYTADDPATPVRSGVITNTSGNAIATGLPEGDYVLVETKAPEGHLRNTDTMTFTITADDIGGAPVQIGPFINYTQAVQLQKQDEDGNALPGAVFGLTNDDTGMVVGSGYTSDDAGIVAIDGLGPGSYTLLETQAPAEFIVDTQPIQFTVPQEASGQPDMLQLNNGQPFINYKEGVWFKKTDADGDGLAGAAFELSRTDGGALPANTTYLSATDGTVGIGGLSPGEYRLVETGPPEGFIRNTAPIDFTIAEETPGQPPILRLDSYPNYLGTAQLTKANGSHDVLAGADFDLVRVEASGDVLIDSYTTDLDGRIDATDLVPGHYEFRETKAPLGYVLMSEAISFDIAAEFEGEPATVQVRAVNTPVPVDPPPVTPVDGNATTVGTGDSFPVIGWAVLALASALALAIMVVQLVRRRKKTSASS